MKLKQKLLTLIFLFPFFARAQFVDIQQTTEELGTKQAVMKADNVINVLLAVVFIASIFGFIFSGVQYIIAGGSEKSLDNARKFRNASLIGLSLALVAYVIMKILQLLVS